MKEIKINQDLLELYNCLPRDFIDIAKGASFGGFRQMLPERTSAALIGVEALYEAWRDINSADSESNEWFKFLS